MNEGNPTASNPVGTASLVLGVLATLSWGCCCCSGVLPLLSIPAMMLTFVLALAATITGFIGRSRAREAEIADTAPTVGVVLGVINFLGIAAWTIIIIFFGGMAILGNALQNGH